MGDVFSITSLSEAVRLLMIYISAAESWQQGPIPA
jgi:hypothetical protein